jgi:hypothetical protein
MKTMTAYFRALHRVTNCLLVLALLLPPSTALAAPAPAPHPAPAVQNAGPGLVVGEVYQDLTGLPLAGASVTLLSGGGAPAATATTDAAGRYRLTAPAGAARLRIEKAGHTSVERAVTVGAGEWAAPLDARLTLLDPARTVAFGARWHGDQRRGRCEFPDSRRRHERRHRVHASPRSAARRWQGRPRAAGRPLRLRMCSPRA